MPGIQEIETVVVVMMENRSFDHMLGHLSLEEYGGRSEVEGLRRPFDKYENLYQTRAYPPFAMEDRPLPSDLPHERTEIADQLDFSGLGEAPSMRGFVKSYYEYTQLVRKEHPEPMGYFPPDEVPITSFLAREYAVCDRWFSPLPTSTQPNRLMAWRGDTHIDETRIGPVFGPNGMPLDDLVIDWLDSQEETWRVYHDDISFFALLLRYDDMFGSRFRWLEQLDQDLTEEGADGFPSVVFIEPSYGSGPHLEEHEANDNHAPLPAANSERFLKRVYRSLTSQPDVWKRTLMIITYDEHGGFHDHVPPPKIGYEPPAGTFEPFEWMGPRVPAIVVSPWVRRGTVFSKLLDHTSILQLLAERFDPEGDGYSESVQARKHTGEEQIHSVSEVLNLDSPRQDPPEAPEPPDEKVATMREVWAQQEREEEEPVEAAFREAVHKMLEERPAETREKHPDIEDRLATARSRFA